MIVVVAISMVGLHNFITIAAVVVVVARDESIADRQFGR